MAAPPGLPVTCSDVTSGHVLWRHFGPRDWSWWWEPLCVRIYANSARGRTRLRRVQPRRRHPPPFFVRGAPLPFNSQFVRLLARRKSPFRLKGGFLLFKNHPLDYRLKGGFLRAKKRPSKAQIHVNSHREKIKREKTPFNLKGDFRLGKNALQSKGWFLRGKKRPSI